MGRSIKAAVIRYFCRQYCLRCLGLSARTPQQDHRCSALSKIGQQAQKRNRKATSEATLQRAGFPIQEVAERRRHIHHHPGRTERVLTFRPTKNASNSSSSSGSAAILTPIRLKTPLKKSITAASPTPTSITLPAYRAGKPTVAGFTSCGDAPDEIDSPSAAAAPMIALRSGRRYETSTYPFEDWRYRYLEGIGENVETGVRRSHHDRRVSSHHGPQRKGRLDVRPRRGLDQMEQMGLASKTAAIQQYRRHALGGAARDASPRIKTNSRASS